MAGSRNRDPRGRNDRDRRPCASVPSCSCSPWRVRVRASELLQPAPCSLGCTRSQRRVHQEANDYSGPRFKSKPVIPPSRPAPQVPGTEYMGGFGTGPAPTLPLRSKPAQYSSRGAPRGLLAPRGNQDSRLPVPSAWDEVYSDDSIRANAKGELVVRGVAPRPGGWAMLDILCRAAEIIRARHNTIFGLCEDQARLEQELDRARNRGSWNQGYGYGYQETKRQRMELESPRYESVCPSAGRSTVTAEGRGAPLAIRRTGLAPLGLPSLEMSKSITSPRTGVTTMPTTFAKTGARTWLRLTRMQAGAGIHRRHVG